MAQAGEQDGVNLVVSAKPGRDVSPKRPCSDLRGRLGEASLPNLTSPQAGENQCLTVNIVMPAMGDTAEGTASFARLLFGLTALALERFGAAPQNHYSDELHELVPSCLAGPPVDPFDGQVLRLRKADSGYQLHDTGPDLRDLPPPSLLSLGAAPSAREDALADC